MELKLLFLGIKSHIAGVLSVVRREYEERRGGGTGAGSPDSTNNSFICVNLEKGVNKKVCVHIMFPNQLFQCGAN